ncbi:hypothetical protein BJX70DRAFT_331200 [Aspergillus crustosus]
MARFATLDTMDIVVSSLVDEVRELQQLAEFHVSVCNNRALADLLWTAGFTDIDETDSDGFTALMRCPSLDFAEWLLSHGADFHYKRNGVPALRYLDNDGQLARIGKYSEACLSTIRMIFEDEYRDDCDCPCSMDGCVTATIFLHKLFFGRSRLPIFREHWRRILDSREIMKGSFELHSAAIIRWMIFEELKIPHTCHFGQAWRDPEEREELQEEYAEQIRLWRSWWAILWNGMRPVLRRGRACYGRSWLAF